MPFAVELYMDDHATAGVRQLWQSLVQAGIPSQPLAAGARPHISLCVCESLDSPLFAKDLEMFPHHFGTISFLLESVKTFPVSNGVVFLAPRANQLWNSHCRHLKR